MKCTGDLHLCEGNYPPSLQKVWQCIIFCRPLSAAYIVLYLALLLTCPPPPPLAKICLHQLIINQDNMEHWQAATPNIGGTLEDWKLVCLVDYSSPHIKQTNRVYKLWRCPILYSPPWSWSCTKVEMTIRENHQSCPGKHICSRDQTGAASRMIRKYADSL